MYYSDDPIADFDAYDADLNDFLSRLPVCVECGNPIQDETAFYIDGDWYCEACMETYRREVLPE